MSDAFADFGPRYRVERRLARGGLCEIFLAHHEAAEGFSRRVVIKALLPHLAHEPDAVKLFLGEAQVGARLTHANLVHLYDFGENAGTHFIVLEYLEGVGLAPLLRAAASAGRKLTPGFVAAVGSQVCSGLAYAHARTDAEDRPLGLVHQGVSPRNLVACADGIVKILDFGVDHARGASAYAEPGVGESAACYLSPEQCGPGPIDARSDLFSLGLVLWELVTRSWAGPRIEARTRWSMGATCCESSCLATPRRRGLVRLATGRGYSWTYNRCTRSAGSPKPLKPGDPRRQLHRQPSDRGKCTSR